MDPPVATPPPAREADVPGIVTFTGQRGPFVGLVVRTTLLTIVTLGIYRFWAKTRLRRYLWGHILIDGEPLEYLGTATELLIGFLIAIAVLAPVGIAFELTSQALAVSQPEVVAVASVVYVVALLGLVQVARFRMWRYRLTRTAWRGVRFGLDGSSLAFAARSLAWFALTGLSLGLAFPWMRLALMRYRLTRLRFGNTPFAFAGSAWPLARRWLVVVLAAMLPLAFLVAANTGWLADLPRHIADETEPPPPADVWLVLLWLAVPPVYVWYRVGDFRTLVSYAGFGEARFASQARAGTVLGSLMVSAIVFVLAMAIVAAVLGVSASLLGDDAEDWGPKLFSLIIIVVVLLLAAVVTQGLFTYDLIRHLCSTLAIRNLAAFEAAAQAADRGPRFGEGMADAFDVGGL